MCEAPTTTIQPTTITNRRTLLRMGPLAVLLALILFPFEWLGAQWPAFGHALDTAFATEAISSAPCEARLNMTAMMI